MTIKEIQEEIIDEFSMFEDWMERYEYIIELGKALPIIDDKHKTEDNLIKGCQSKVWLHAELKEDKLIYSSDSDAILIEVEQKGGIACHTGRHHCFYQQLVDGQWQTTERVLKDPKEMYK